MRKLSRRSFLRRTAVGAAIVGATSRRALAAPTVSRRILVGSGTPDGILAFHWDSAKGELKPDGIAAKISHSTWLDLSPDRRYLYVACELDEFEGKPTGAVASFSLSDGKLTQISAVSSGGKGTCHLNVDRTGSTVICANYTGGSASSFHQTGGNLGKGPVWTESYPGYPKSVNGGHGPVADRQEAAHAHFAGISPDNRYAYINDLGSDLIHIYKLDAASASLTPAGEFKAHAGAGPRTLHFLEGSGAASGKVAYSVNELDSTIDVLHWDAATGSLSPIEQISLLPAGYTGITRACDTVLTRDGRFAYFANRDKDFLIAFTIDPATGKLTPLGDNPRTSCGGATPRNFRLDPTECWMLVANQTSGNLSVFARDPQSGKLANEGKSVAAATPMCIVFV